jgi:hypothetical protein
MGLIAGRNGWVEERDAAQLRNDPPVTACGVRDQSLRNYFDVPANSLTSQKLLFIKDPEVFLERLILYDRFHLLTCSSPFTPFLKQ